jgi:hypothetical protein
MIYAIQAGKDGPVKFGLARNPQSRIKDLQVAHHEQLYLLASQKTSDDQMIERLLHKQHAEYRIRGEWFSPSAAVLATVETMKEAKAETSALRRYCEEIVNKYRAIKHRADLMALLHALQTYDRRFSAAQPVHQGA